MSGKSSPMSTIQRQQRMLRALRACNGIVTRSAKAAGITSQTHYNWIREDETYQKNVAAIKFECFEDFKDLVMEAVIKKVKQGNTTIIALCYKTVLAEQAETLQKLSPYRDRLKMSIRVMPNPNPNYAKDPFTQQAIREYEETLQRQREGKQSS